MASFMMAHALTRQEEAAVNNYLIKYNRRSGDSEVFEFPGRGNRSAAIQERLRLESTSTSDDEIVVIAADSRADLERTHSRYFKSASELAAN
jgi:hypothetical protein